MSAPCAGSISGAQLPAAFRQLRFGGSCTPRRQRTLHRTAALPGSNGPPGRPGGGLILPGSDDFPAAGLPGGARRPGGGPAGFGPSGQATPRDGPLYQPFRPPPAYKDTASQSKDEMLNKLTSAHWELALTCWRLRLTLLLVPPPTQPERDAGLTWPRYWTPCTRRGCRTRTCLRCVRAAGDTSPSHWA